jgi:Ca2+-binding RTX toxin-like protein
MPQYPANIDLSTINGSNGFKITGEAIAFSADRAHASAGDVNGDGFIDLIIGTTAASPHGTYSGAAYVVFGSASGFGASVNLSTLNGSNGFKMSGQAANDQAGFSVASAGDVNGDGYADVIVSARAADPHGSNSGASYVVFGHAGGFSANIELSSLDGSNGFKISGVGASDLSGQSVASAGDINGDGFDDMIVGAPQAGGFFGAGAAYVVFGHAGGFGANIDLSSLDGTNGFTIRGAAPHDQTGWSVASAGDFNGDGIADIIIGAVGVETEGVKHGEGAGASYVVFGKTGGFGSNIDVSSLDGTNGFKISGGASQTYNSGNSVASAGDINGDGYDDLIIGAFGANPHGETSGSGASYVVFGRAGGFAGGGEFRLPGVNGHNGFKISGVARGDNSGWSVASAGDVNGDGFDDVIVGSPGARQPGVGFSTGGAAYVVFGHAGGFDANIDLSSLDGTNGFTLRGPANGPSEQLGGSVASAGDLNDDGFADLFVGAEHFGSVGTSYVVYGRAPDTAVDLTGTKASQTLAGGSFDDVLHGQAGDDLLYGNGGNDLLVGGVGNDVMKGGDGNDRLWGFAGNDVLNGGTGDDEMHGGLGDDTYYVDSRSDRVFEAANEGTDTVHTTVSHTLAPNVEILIADSDAGLSLRGNAADNTIIGGGGNDHLFGGLGRDILTGDAGDDTFVYQSTADSGTTAATRDTINDFNSGDVIDLSAIDAIAGGAHDDFNFIGNGDFTAAGQVRWESVGGNTLVQVNTGGSLGADMSILLQGAHSLTVDDFKLS